MYLEFAKYFNFIQQVVDVALSGRGIGNDHAEEVGSVSEGLVSDHRTSSIHQVGFDLRRHLDNSAKK